jgi:hypothetical protein
MNGKELVIAYGDDWEGLYIDGQLQEEGHSISLYHFCKAVGIELTQKGVDTDWLENRGNLPSKISEVKFEDQD